MRPPGGRGDARAEGEQVGVVVELCLGDKACSLQGEQLTSRIAKDAASRIAAEQITPCPPGIPDGCCGRSS
jgi:hypothetical protein